MKQVILTLLLLSVGIRAHGANFYVDASAAGGDGSQAAPFTTIKDAVVAANGASAPSTIYVASGTYAITSASDFASVSVPDLTITAANPSSKPVIALDADLSVSANNPAVFAVPQGSDRLTVANLKFTFSYAANKNAAGNSLGESGKIFSFAANDCVFDGCEFFQTGTTGQNWKDGGVLYADSSEQAHGSKGTGLVVRNCRFDHVGTSSFRPIKFADDSQIVGNVFDTCSGYFTVHKQSSGGYFVSNRVVNCTQPIKSNGDNYGEIQNGEIAYNIFVGSDIPFFEKVNNSGYSGQPRFHHNTVIGCSGFVQVDDVDKISWTPWIFDNLVIASGTGCIIRENAASLANRTSSFKEGSFFTGNAWHANEFVSGTAPHQFDDYELSLVNTEDLELYNEELAVIPTFLNTSDPTSPDYYRLNAQRYPWVYTLARGASGTINKKEVSYAATYVGAVEPANIPGEPGEFFELERFSIHLSTNIVPARADFTVGYTGNAGPVTVDWDFDGDGTWDLSGSEVSTTWTYTVPGDFLPKVRITDSGTSKTDIEEHASALIIRMMDVYVDATAAEGGNGTEMAPLRSIAAAVSLCASHGTVHIRSGDNRVYNIATADDLATVTADRHMTITKWGEERARIVVASTLHSVTNNPSVISIPVGIVHTTISGLDFTYYGSSTKDAPDSSLGKSGRCIDVQGDYTTVDDCVFRQSGDYARPNGGSITYSAPATGIGHAAVATRAQQTDKHNGRYLTVSRCSFLGESEDRSMAATRLGENSTLSGNVFSNCCYVLWAVKESGEPFLIESNILYRCGTISTGIYGGAGEFQNAEIRFNIFWCDSENAVPFITKNNNGLNKTVLIHHNTIVNAAHFAEIDNRNTLSWYPQIFDNLFVLAPTSEDSLTIFKNNQTAFASGCYSSFTTGGDGCLKNNAWYAPGGISGGAATQVPSYDLSRGCTITNNIVLADQPAFASTQLDSPDFCRPLQRNGGWVGPGHAWIGDNGEYADWIGAKQVSMAGIKIFLR